MPYDEYEWPIMKGEFISSEHEFIKGGTGHPFLVWSLRLGADRRKVKRYKHHKTFIDIDYERERWDNDES